MRISILCSDEQHPIYPLLLIWQSNRSKCHNIEVVNRLEKLSGGDILFLISCTEIIRHEVRKKYTLNLVIHESDLPHGRGWSPLAWQILEGKDDIVVSLLEAEDKVDTGAIFVKRHIFVEKHELLNEINIKLFQLKLDLMDFAIENCKSATLTKQPDCGASYYNRRTAEDSCINPNETIANQFDLLRICDPDRYPAYFELHGHRYKLVITKI